ncbi:MAG: hypothetical protein ER33_15230 [Cyanobium sp. CACIAM 14]|nr:MAG: hypothetical protein ER33_15230 [Cyanobium sp. CACIAM 14]
MSSMAETTANDVARRYAVIEQAYSKEDWGLVLRDGEELLQQLRQTGTPQFLGLRLRLQLLLGHTHLYGYADRAAAARCYGDVASESIEAPLTKIAEQGLKECQATDPPAAKDPANRAEAPVPELESLPTATPVPPATAPAQSAPAPEPFGGPAEALLPTPAPAPFAIPGPAATPGPVSEKITSPAAPWLTDAAPAIAAASIPTAAIAVPPIAVPEATTPAEPPTSFPAAAVAPPPSPAAPLPPAASAAPPWQGESLIPEVVEEPELIELHQADPALAEEVEVSWKEQASAPGAETPGISPELSRDDEELVGGLLLVRIG